MTAAYAAFFNGGARVTPYGVERAAHRRRSRRSIPTSRR